ncbi:hypothetical protein NQ318_006584 [Aromia moschata]|uniref:Uncharacterized protein n=1 Tax=Aromia moschata TaxID=1265417 RepID=A0AAV8XZ63_9CUCU|nr:hypothetical protein NQ318_006584 [Aromia moschata]
MCGDKSSNINNTRMDEQISLTQEIRESGISNTQIMCAVDEVLNSVELARNNTDRDFRGFDKKEIMEYENIFQNFVKVFMSVQDHRKSSRSIFSITQKNMAESESSQSRIINVQDKYLQKAKRMFDDIDETLPLQDSNEVKRILQKDGLNNVALGGFTSASGKDFDLTDIYDKFGSRTFGFQTGKNNLSKAAKKDPWKTPTVNGANQREKPIRRRCQTEKRLGISSCKLLPISNNKLEKARLIFDEDFSKLSPVRPKQNNVYMSTPIRQNTSSTPGKFDLKAASVAGNSCNTPIRNDIEKPSRSFNSFLEGIAITPIKHDATEEERTIENPPIIDCHGDIVMKSPTRGDAEEWLRRLQEDRKKLEDRLSIVIERQKAMENLGRKKSAVDTRPRKGVLYLSKTSGNKVPLGCFVNNKKPGDEYVDFSLLDINPLNSEYVHFKDQSYAVLNTEDGATVVPNLNDIVGASEIEMAFMAMPGVEPHLFPAGGSGTTTSGSSGSWLATRGCFPASLGGCLNVENVVQQLKYRYDREIDRAERSALRRIYEKDDAPRKRLVLCVSGIRKDNMGQLELELTDGWYRIRTVIDEPLRNQATELTCLKINFNSTRRTHWDTKLGYQNVIPSPSPFPYTGVHPLGGPVGAIKICIVRTYPFKYLEKCDDCSVWRNGKAEERRAQQWEYDRCKKLERIRGKRAERAKNLSSSQRAAIKDYWEKATLRKQRTIEERINEDVSKLRLTKRDVSAILKLLVVDVNGSSDRGFSFSVWRPGEALLHVLKEGAVLTVQNVLPQKNGDMSSCAKGIFKPGSSAPHLYNDFKRRLTQIANLTESNFSPTFNEFDTVGACCSWINVYEGPSTCLLLDSVKRGEPTTVCNLVYREATDHVARAVANHYTVFSSYSRHKHLQEGLEMFKKWLPKDTGALLDVCDSKIESFSLISSKSVKAYASFDETDSDTTLMSSRLTSTDVALSLLDVDQFT